MHLNCNKFDVFANHIPLINGMEVVMAVTDGYLNRIIPICVIDIGILQKVLKFIKYP